MTPNVVGTVWNSVHLLINLKVKPLKKIFTHDPTRISVPPSGMASKCILRMPAVKNRVGLSRSTIYEAISKGKFPAPISLGLRAVGWLESDIDAWVESRILVSNAL